jgi:hypothetical protein
MFDDPSAIDLPISTCVDFALLAGGPASDHLSAGNGGKEAKGDSTNV